ncbi:MAG: hypothetical protein ACYDBV_13445 [Nitrospiria bacterium]
MKDFSAHIELPEPIVEVDDFKLKPEKPAGVEIIWEADRPQVMGNGQGSVTRLAPECPTGIWKLKISQLPAHTLIQIPFVTSVGPAAKKYLVAQEYSNEEDMHYFLEGSFQDNIFVGKFTSQKIFVHFVFDTKQRELTSLPSQEDFEMPYTEFYC